MRAENCELTSERRCFSLVLFRSDRIWVLTSSDKSEASRLSGGSEFIDADASGGAVEATEDTTAAAAAAVSIAVCEGFETGCWAWV